MGIYGDFLFGEANRAGRGTKETLLGPTVSDFAEVVDLLKKALRGDASASEGLRPAMAAAVASIMAKGSPAAPAAAMVLNGYPRIALDYLILYRIQEELSPGYLRRTEQRMRQENAQEFFIPPPDVVR